MKNKKEILIINNLQGEIYQVENKDETTVYFQGSFDKCIDWLTIHATLVNHFYKK
jgi:hypothetical protein